MNRKIILSAIAITLLGSAAVLAQGAAQPQQPMSFFVTSAVPGHGNLGGLAGADQICQNLAAAAGAGNRTWHAYLSQTQQGNQPSVNARGRIGNGPWYNAKGVLIASNVADLHGDNNRDRNNIQKTVALNEKGEVIKGFGDMPNQHDAMTGSDSEGRAFPAGFDDEQGDAGSHRPPRRRQHVVELGSSQPQLHGGRPDRHRRRGQVLLLRHQLSG